jgi:hypothetical protein
MNTYSEYIDITSEKIIINIPSDFYKGKALLEITPLPEEISETNLAHMRRENFKKLLLQRPSCLTKEEINNFKKISKWIKEWNPEEY